jgi:tetratricopeptide (TPR) repeat protein
VANIKGRDEILALLFSLVSMIYAVRYARSGEIKWLVLVVPMFLLAVLSKESAYPLIAVIPLAGFVFFKNTQRKRIMMASGAVLAAGVMGFAIRAAVVGVSFEESNELMNNPFLEASFGEKLATIFFCLGNYLRLLFLPHPLTNDYYPYHVQLHSFGDPIVVVALVLNLVIGMVGLWLVFSKKHPLGFGILFYFLTISIVSNLVVPVGTFMSERLIFIPSIGFCIALAWLITWTGRKFSALSAMEFLRKNTVGSFLLLAVLVGYSFKTITRNQDWKDSLTLFTKDVEVSDGSAKAQNAAGGSLFEKAMTFRDTLMAYDKQPANEPVKDRLKSQFRDHLSQSKLHLLRAVEIYPAYSAAWLTLGNIYYYLDNNIDSMIISYRRAGEQASYRNLEIVANELLGTGKFDDAIKSYNELNRVSPQKPEYLVALGRAYGQGKNDLTQAMALMDSALAIDPNNAETLKQLGTVHAITAEKLIASNGDLALATEEVRTAISLYLRAEKLDPDDPALMRNIALAYQRLNMKAEYEVYMQKARSLGSM